MLGPNWEAAINVARTWASATEQQRWDARDARAERDARDARDARAVRDVRDAWAAWAALAVRDVRDAWAAWAAWAAWDAWAAFVAVVTHGHGLIDDDMYTRITEPWVTVFGPIDESTGGLDDR
jgi:hypothetical protein